jgi:hypothetical protein
MQAFYPNFGVPCVLHCDNVGADVAQHGDRYGGGAGGMKGPDGSGGSVGNGDIGGESAESEQRGSMALTVTNALGDEELGKMYTQHPDKDACNHGQNPINVTDDSICETASGVPSGPDIYATFSMQRGEDGPSLTGQSINALGDTHDCAFSTEENRLFGELDDLILALFDQCFVDLHVLNWSALWSVLGDIDAIIPSTELLRIATDAIDAIHTDISSEALKKKYAKNINTHASIQSGQHADPSMTSLAIKPSNSRSPAGSVRMRSPSSSVRVKSPSSSVRVKSPSSSVRIKSPPASVRTRSPMGSVRTAHAPSGAHPLSRSSSMAGTLTTLTESAGAGTPPLVRHDSVSQFQWLAGAGLFMHRSRAMSADAEVAKKRAEISAGNPDESNPDGNPDERVARVASSLLLKTMALYDNSTKKFSN